MTRALLVLRLSRDTESSSSIERQREAVTAECERRGWVVVGEAVDVDVSGSVDPFVRPGLGKWLREPHRFDAIVAQKMDRLTRDTYGKEILGRWAQEHGITILAEGQEYDSLAAGVLALVAQGELRKISERTKEAYDRNMRKGNYRGGHPPFGYRPVKVGNAWRLEIDPEEAELIREIIGRVLDGVPASRIVEDLNVRAVPTTRDRDRIRAGKPIVGHRWATANLIRLLQQETLLGYAMQADPIRKRGVIQTATSKNGRTRKAYTREKRVILGEDGLPVRRAEPLISESDFEKVKAALAVRTRSSPTRRKHPASLLLQVIFCGVCGRPMYAFRARPTRVYYRCASTVSRPVCENLSARLGEMDEFVGRSLLAHLGDFPNVRRVYVPGNDHTDRLAEINRQLDSLRRAVTVFEGGELDRLLGQVKALNDVRSELEAEPVVEPGYRYEPTDVLFRDFWGGLTAMEKNQWLRDHKVRLTYTRTKHGPQKLGLEFGDFPHMLASIDPDTAAALDRDPAFSADLMTRVGELFSENPRASVHWPEPPM